MLSPTLKQLFDRLRQLLAPLAPYKDIIIFVITLLVADGVWKLLIHGEEQGSGDVTCLGWVVTPLFDFLAERTAAAAYWVVDLFRDTVHLCKQTHLFFDSGNGTHIVWSCTPVKQSFIWLCLMATAMGPWLHKSWFIPLGWVIIYGVNIVRIAAIALIIEYHPDLFQLMHAYVFKYAFYGIIFLLWLCWNTHWHTRIKSH